MKTIFQKREYSVKWWEGETLPTPFLALDTETEIKPSYMVPEMATMQAYAGGDTVYYVPMSKVNVFLEAHSAHEVICHNAAFDIRVLERHTGLSFLEKYKKGKIWDTSIMYRLLHLATVGDIPFKYNLAMLSERFLNEVLDKDDAVRLEFGQFIGREELIPSTFLEYGAKDVIATYLLFHHFRHEMQKTESSTWLSHGIQAGADYVLKRIHENGIGFDLEKRDAWLAEKDQRIRILENKLAMWGFQRGVKGSKERFIASLVNHGIIDKTYPRTESGEVSIAGEDLEKFNHLELIRDYLEFIEIEKACSFVKNIQSTKVHPKYNVIVNTGRTSCTKPNFQQLPRLGGIREMFVASPGHTFLITDYSMLELVTLSQVCLNLYGESEMADKINEGIDLHKAFAAQFYNKSIEAVTKSERQTAKAANFGYPGGLGPDTFIEYAAGLGVKVDRATALELRETWKSTFPEMRKYLHGGKNFDDGGTMPVMTATGRVRGNCNFCAAKNTPFQGLAADGAKLALFYLHEAGFKIVGFVHDEIITEVPVELAEKMLAKQEEIMVQSMYKVTPQVAVRVESQISATYTK